MGQGRCDFLFSSVPCLERSCRALCCCLEADFCSSVTLLVREISSVVAALKHLRAVTDYVTRNKLEAWKEEAELASQLADLLEQKMVMLQALAARQQPRN